MSFTVAIIKKHNIIGYIINFYLADRRNKHFIELAEMLTSDITENKDNLPDDILSIIKSADAYSYKNLTKIFGKGKKLNDFFKSLTKEDIEKRIRPFIEKQLIRVIDKLNKTDIKLYLKKDKFNTLYEEDLIKIQKESAKTIFNIIKGEESTEYFLSVKHKGENITLFNRIGIVLTNNPCRLILGGNLYRFEDIDGKKLLPFFIKKNITVPRKLEKKWYETFAVNAMKNYAVNPVGFSITEKTESFLPVIKVEKDWKNEYVFLLFYKYESKEYQHGLPYESILFFEENTFSFVKFLRDTKAENEIVKKLKVSGLSEQNGGAFKINFKGTDKDEQKHRSILFLKEKISFFEENNIKVVQNFFEKKYFTEKISLNLNAQSSKDWFDIYGTVKFGTIEIPFIRLRNNILRGKREFILPDKSIALIPEEWFAEYGDLFMFGNEKDEVLKIGKTHFKAIENAKIQGIDISFKKNISKLLNYKKYKVAIPENIKVDLRVYQKEGFKMMRFLRDAGFGVCLADDMGLGKTLQTITLLQDTVNERKKDKNNYAEQLKSSGHLNLFSVADNDKKYQRKASLIVMPVSLIHNWDNELRKFAPELKVLKYRGADRQRYIEKFDNYDVILTGYASVRNDIEDICKHEFLYVILDESQFVKNSSSKTYRAVLKLNFEYKAVLTGTPVENSLSDLWSQMNFINNGMLGNEHFFRETFIKPIEKEKDEISEQKLKSIISPFIIRRTKNEVAKDLPELTEQIIYCVQDEEQKKIYETEKSKIRNKFIKISETGEKKNISATVLAALMKLRQISNHPKLTDETYEGESGKFKVITRNAESIIAENHKILIFSSFVKHLELFAKYFEEKSVKFSILTGQTKNREAVISEFQNNDDNKVFLISIKAGGTGLNLTEADYVFILDPWWNPAVEKQAVNRAHRIGQKRNVMVYKYITENSVEEKILNLQKSKSELADLLVPGDNVLGKMTKEMISDLLELKKHYKYNP